MDYLYAVFVIILGLSLGSFLSVLVFRLDSKKGILMGRSECPRCLTRLKWYDLVPVLSFLSVRGKCRYCKERISSIYPAMEISIAFSFALYLGVNGFYFSISSFYDLTIIFMLLALVFFDLVYFILPDKIIFSAVAVSFFYFLIFRNSFILNSLITGFVLALFFAIIYLVSRGEWIGFGDVKLSFLIGFVLGYPLALFSTLFSVWIGAFGGLALIAAGKADLKTPLPFGSFMGVLAVLFIIFTDYAQNLLALL